MACQTKNNNDLPNIIIIFTDDQGYQDLGCFGAEGFETPNIDQMAKEGAQFTNFYVAQGVCSASRAALLTGCYSNRIGIHGALMPNMGIGLDSNEVTIAELLKEKNYATAIYGKWHLGSEPEFNPIHHGFDEFFGIPYSNDMWPLHPWQGSVFDFDSLPLYEQEKVVTTLSDQSNLTVDITKRAVSFIERNKQNPFFLYVPHPQPHVPLFVSDRFKGSTERGLYGDVIAEIDWSTGEIMKALEENGLTENTLIIFASDNGPWLSYGTHSGSALPLREGKGTAWEGGVRSPCVMKFPKEIPAGQIISKPAMTIDILPTIASLVGADLPPLPIDGKDMLPLMRGSTEASPHHQAYYFYYKQNELHGVMSGDGQWKLYLPHTYRSLNGRMGTDDGLPIPYDTNEAQLELYNLRDDVSETQNLAEERQDIVIELSRHVNEARAMLGDRLTEVEGRENRPIGKSALGPGKPAYNPRPTESN